jgi:hypothetical protein
MVGTSNTLVDLICRLFPHISISQFDGAEATAAVRTALVGQKKVEIGRLLVRDEERAVCCDAHVGRKAISKLN